MGKMTWILDEIEDCVIVSRVVDSGEEDQDKQPILKVSRISRKTVYEGIAEIRASLDMLEKELKDSEKDDKKTTKSK
jgi:hypothetical protein